ncbi:hypothetical protein PT286_06775 [Neisseriaceae bacterium ESL0693]|nr:hypothetical protein [Neisseriaceae bacterium ESL0693]
MKKILLPAAALLLALTGCASHGDKSPATQSAAVPAATANPTVNPDMKIDSQKAIAYTCGTKGDTKLTVMYGFSGDTVAAAQVELQGKATPVLLRVTNEGNYNKFMSASPEGFVWATPVATKSSLEQVNGLGLAQPSIQTVKGKQLIVPQVVTQNCQLDAQATAALARQAETATAAPVKHVKKTKVIKTTKKVVKAKK